MVCLKAAVKYGRLYSHPWAVVRERETGVVGAVDKVRVDKWLWAARFFKTRTLAARAVTGGHVHVNGLRVKAARPVQPGDRLHIRRGEQEFTIIVQALSGKRGPAKTAATLYEETKESIAAREAARCERRLIHAQAACPDRRPDKRERRKIRKFLRKD
ncbi:MAG TPA: RNA-binding protein [Desulfobulbus sp.]|nr:RNA-binding protein [Desulfobulbus sp.]